MIRPKNIIVWLYYKCLKKTELIGRIVNFFFFFFFVYKFGGFETQKIKWSQIQVFLNGQMVYYTTKVLVGNTLWGKNNTFFCLVVFFFFFFCASLMLCKFAEKQFWGKFFAIKRIQKKKKSIWVGPAVIRVGWWSTTKQFFFLGLIRQNRTNTKTQVYIVFVYFLFNQWIVRMLSLEEHTSRVVGFFLVP